MAGAEGLAACFAFLWLADRCRATVPVSPLVAKNSPQDCFLTLRPSRVQVLIKKRAALLRLFPFGRGRRTWSRLPARSVLLHTSYAEVSTGDPHPLQGRQKGLFNSGSPKSVSFLGRGERNGVFIINFVKIYSNTEFLSTRRGLAALSKSENQ